jgi:hypothetical protein
MGFGEREQRAVMVKLGRAQSVEDLRPSTYYAQGLKVPDRTGYPDHWAEVCFANFPTQNPPVSSPNRAAIAALHSQ